MSTIKISELATNAISLTDFFAKADASGVASKNDIQGLSNFLNTVGTLAFRGVLLAADAAATLDGVYVAGDAGTYTNNGGLVITVSNQIVLISITGTQTVFEKVEIPITITIDAIPTDGSANAVQSGGVFDAEFKNSNILNDAISSSKTDFAKTGKNLFNIVNSSLINNWCNYSTGAFESYPSNEYIEGYKYSGYIPVKSLTDYSRNNEGTGTCFFDRNKVFISGTQNATFTTPTNCYYVILNHTIELIQLEKGSIYTIYEDFGYKFNSILTEDILQLNINDRNFLKTPRNLLNIKNLSLVNNSASLTTGIFETNTGYRHSKFISIFPSNRYVRKYGARGTCFYDINFNFISSSVSDTFRTPSNAKYIIINISTSTELDEIVNFGISIYSENNIYKESLNTFDTGKNLFNIEEISNIQEWCNYTNGDIETNQYIVGFKYSNPIFIKPETSYIRKDGSRGTSFFDKEMKFISGTQSNTFTTPVNTKYCIMNLYYTLPFEQLEEGLVSTNYEKFKNGGVTLIGENEINIPKNIYGIVDKELNVYFDNTIINNAKDYQFRVIDSISSHQTTRILIDTSSAISDALSVQIYKDKTKDSDCLYVAKSNINIVSDSAGSGVTKKYMQIGDSTTAGLMSTGELQNVFSSDVMSLTQVGTQGTAPNLHEGYPGEDTSFISEEEASPFVFSGVFDFSQYMTTQGFSGVDYVMLTMGINDMYAIQTDAAAQEKSEYIVGRYNAMITSMKSYNSEIKVGVALTIPPSISQDAFNEVQAQTRFRHKRNVSILVKNLIASFSDMEGSNIYIVPINCNLDTDNNFKKSLQNANSRTTEQVYVYNDALHPADTGYYQICDSVYYWIKNIV